MGRRYKQRTIPEQNRKICGSICFCQFTIVISCVALVYLSVAIYMPSHRAFNAGIEPNPVMCQTINATLVNYCAWASCGEWCLTKTTGFCPQIHATVRRNGTDLILKNCTNFRSIPCPQVNVESSKRFNCNNGSECSSLAGVFNCSLGHCSNMSELMLCRPRADGIVIDSEKDNMKLNGFFSCQNARCTKIKRAFSCDRYCPKIRTLNVNVFLVQDDNIFTSRCSHGYALNRANGYLPGERLDEPEKVWDDENSKAIVASCFRVTKDATDIRTEDCVNGTLVKEASVTQPYINFTTFLTMYEKSLAADPVDPSDNYIPSQRSLTIYNTSRLYINLEGCVNTLRGECRDFLGSHGRDGDNHTSQSRYPCYYNKNDSFFVVARFDLRKTKSELLIATIVPSVLFVVSLTTLVIITRSVRVGDDGKMRCTYCSTEEQSSPTPGGESEGLVEDKSSTPATTTTNHTEIRSLGL